MPQPIINDILPLTQIVAGTSQTIFSTNWTANAASDVVVYDTPFGNTPNDVTDIVDPSNYVVSFVGTFQTVLVTFNSAPPQNDTITITRMTPVSRQNLYTNSNFTPSMLNNDFEIFTLEIQENELVNQQKGPRYNYSAIVTQPLDTILPILGPNQFWAKDAANTSIVAVDIGSIGTGGTVTDVNTGTGLTGGPITTSGTISLVVPVTIPLGGTGVIALPLVPTASAFAAWDANKNLSANNFNSGYATTATAAGTTVLTVASPYQQYFTGVTTQSLVMPVASTLVLGQSWYVVNNSTGTVTVKSSGGNTILAMLTDTWALFTCILTSGTTAASWNFESSDQGTITLPLSMAQGGTGANLTAANGAVPYSTASVMALLAPGTSGQLFQSGGAGAPNWTTNQYPSTDTKGDILYASANNFISGLAIGTAGQVLTVAVTGLPAWANSFRPVAGPLGSILISNGSAIVNSTSLWPNTVGTVGQIIRSDGTENVYSTATFPDPAGTLGNVLVSDGANWLSECSFNS